MTAGKYSIELCSECGPDAGIEGVITSEDDLTKARALYRLAIAHNPDRVILLATARGSWRAADRPDTMPS